MEKEFSIPYTYVLQEPIQWDEENPRDKITVQRRLKAKDFKGISATDMKFDHMIGFISKITGEPTAFIEELDAYDMMKLTEVVNSFLPHGLKTGDNL